MNWLAALLFVVTVLSFVELYFIVYWWRHAKYWRELYFEKQELKRLYPSY